MYGVSKGGFGGGLGILAVPPMSLALSATQVTGIVLPCLPMMDAVGVGAYRRRFDRLNLIVLLPSGLLGNLLGCLTLAWFNDRLPVMMIGVGAVTFSLHT